ncbi:hypothetical protein NDR87_12055 [Nocardia sp. CDC159]|uniref:3-hydroxyacyl-CoA dehydrogenase n=1 Tax=Nocardia pulmonis TaxID=2951408 RepID=A0A9X2IYS2_9NOCA|nr:MULTISPECIES: hypothetical protein [Nocardia]MCM6774206.1 hypothetical protein [Nocardia pulmonis]MCM6787093.1 hypothetical protein [Nocardia sp. CDC159]
MFTSLLVLGIASGTIERIDLSDNSVRTIVDDTGPAPDGLVVDPGADRMYWTTMGLPRAVSGGGEPDFSQPNGSLWSARLDGSDRREVVPVGALTTGKQLTADLAAQRLYWSDREGCRVSRVDTDGTGRIDLVVNAPTADKTAECVGVAVDPDAGYLYWTQKGPAKGGRGAILRAGLDIPLGETAAHRSDIEILWDGLPEPIDLHIDPAAGVLYWTDRGAEPWGNTLNRAPLPGKNEVGAHPEILARGFEEAIGLAVDTDAGLAYVTDLAGTVRAVPLDPSSGATEFVVARFPGRPLTGIAGI